jgi:hypothetical protein
LQKNLFKIRALAKHPLSPFIWPIIVSMEYENGSSALHQEEDAIATMNASSKK